MKKKAEEEAKKKAATLEGQASEEIPKEVIIESLKTMIGEEELKKATASDQVLEEVVLDAIIVVFEDEQQKEELDAKVQSALETSAEIFSTMSVERDTKL